MASTVVFQRYTCPICYESYTAQRLPHAGPCGHTLCGECLSKTYALPTSGRKCATCRVQLPKMATGCNRIFFEYGNERDGIGATHPEDDSSPQAGSPSDGTDEWAGLSHAQRARLADLLERNKASARKEEEYLKTIKTLTEQYDAELRKHTFEARRFQFEKSVLEGELNRARVRVKQVEEELDRRLGQAFLSSTTEQLVAATPEDRQLEEQVGRQLEMMTPTTILSLATTLKMKDLKSTHELKDLRAELTRVREAKDHWKSKFNAKVLRAENHRILELENARLNRQLHLLATAKEEADRRAMMLQRSLTTSLATNHPLAVHDSTSPEQITLETSLPDAHMQVNLDPPHSQEGSPSSRRISDQSMRQAPSQPIVIDLADEGDDDDRMVMPGGGRRFASIGRRRSPLTPLLHQAISSSSAPSSSTSPAMSVPTWQAGQVPSTTIPFSFKGTTGSHSAPRRLGPRHTIRHKVS